MDFLEILKSLQTKSKLFYKTHYT